MAGKKGQEGTKEPTAATVKGDKPSPSRKASPASDPANHNKAAPLSSARATLPVISPQSRHAMIAEAAYYRAEQRGDGPGDPDQDWYEAEEQIDQMLEGMIAADV